MMMLMMKIGGSWLPVVWCPHGQQCYGTNDDDGDSCGERTGLLVREFGIRIV